MLACASYANSAFAQKLFLLHAHLSSLCSIFYLAPSYVSSRLVLAAAPPYDPDSYTYIFQVKRAAELQTIFIQ